MPIHLAALLSAVLCTDWLRGTGQSMPLSERILYQKHDALHCSARSMVREPLRSQITDP